MGLKSRNIKSSIAPDFYHKPCSTHFTTTSSLTCPSHEMEYRANQGITRAALGNLTIQPFKPKYPAQAASATNYALKSQPSRPDKTKANDDDRLRTSNGATLQADGAKAEKTKAHEQAAQQALHHASARQKWESKAAHYVTPGLPPLAEPPLLNWKQFKRTHIFSDLRYEKLFPDGNSTGTEKGKAKEKRARMKDLQGESAACWEYMFWLQSTLEYGVDSQDHPLDDSRREFYKQLQIELEIEFEAVERERTALLAEATELGRFDFKYLDNDGRTTRIEKFLRKGANVFEGYGEKAIAKYGHLKPKDWKEVWSATYQAQNLDDDGGSTRVQYEFVKSKESGEKIPKFYLPEDLRGMRYTKAEKRNMWTTPGLRPLAEPPALNPWIKYVEKADRQEMHIEACIDLNEPDRDKEYARLFPDNLGRRMYLEDLRMEETAMLEYHTWCGTNRLSEGTDESRKKFYYDLEYEIFQDCLDVTYEGQAFWTDQAVLDEAKRLKDIEKANRAREEAERWAKLKRLKYLKAEDERKLAEEKEEEARRYAASWMGRVNKAWVSADQVIRKRY